MEKYRILWLDDEFVDENGSANLPLPLIRGRYPQFEIVTKQYVDWCEEELRTNSESYQAVILDANGKYSTQPTLEPNKIGFEDNISIAKSKGLPVYVFSGQLEIKETGDQADITKRNLKRAGFIENVNLFFKSGTYKLLLDKVLSDLKSDFAIFFEYPEILDNVLHYGVNRECVQKLLLWMKDNSRPFPEYISLRRIFFDEVVDARLKVFFGDISAINPKDVTEECMTKWEKTIILFLFKNLINAEVHNWPSDDYQSQQIIANAFITAMKWYNRFMHKVEKNPDPHVYYTSAESISKTEPEDNKPNITGIKVKTINEPFVGIIEVDKDGFYHVGKYILKSNWAKNNVGTEVRVVNSRHFNYKELATYTEPIKD